MMALLKKVLVTFGAISAGLLLVFSALLLWPLPEIPRQGVSGDFLIRNVNVVDVEAGALLRAQDVLVEHGQIVSVQASGSPPRQSLQVIDGTDRYLMPGLWDMHTHSTKLASQYQHPLFIANGVTGVRDMWGCMSEPDSFFACIVDRLRWNGALDDRTGLSPRYVGQSSYQINGGNEVPAGYPDFLRARTPGEARKLANFYAEAGATFLKTYSELFAESYFAMADEARAIGVSLQGHRPFSVSLLEALAAGQKSIEHGRLFLFECHPEAADFRKLADPLGAYTLAFRAKLVDEHDELRCQELMAAMANSDTWWTPTLLTMKMGARAGDSDYRNDPRLKYVPYLLKALMWAPDADRKVTDSEKTPGRNVYADMYDLAVKIVAQAHQAGI